jgi:hypothetical protein
MYQNRWTIVIAVIVSLLLSGALAQGANPYAGGA